MPYDENGGSHMIGHVSCDSVKYVRAVDEIAVSANAKDYPGRRPVALIIVHTLLFPSATPSPFKVLVAPSCPIIHTPGLLLLVGRCYNAMTIQLP